MGQQAGSVVDVALLIAIHSIKSRSDEPSSRWTPLQRLACPTKLTKGSSEGTLSVDGPAASLLPPTPAL